MIKIFVLNVNIRNWNASLFLPQRFKIKVNLEAQTDGLIS